MQAGRLNSRVTLQRQVAGVDAAGGVSNTYADVRGLWASIEPLLGREQFAAQQIQADISVRVRVRYASDFVATMRLKFVRSYDSPEQVEYYDIEAVLNVGELRNETLLMCRKRDADGFRGA